MKESDIMSEFRFKKKFGQNFLQNKNIIRKIALVADVKPKSLIIEVGPGSGNLTVYLAELYKDSNILAYEIDTSLEEVLSDRFSEFNNIKVLFNDFLKVDILSDVKSFSYDNLYFVSNVPYYITTPILFKLVESNLSFQKIVMMVQKEVGDRFSSKPSNKEYSAITVILNYFFDIKKEFVVDRNQFYPRPNVDSVVVSFSRKDKLEELSNKELFIRLVHDSFQFRRKTLRNNLKKYDLVLIESVLEKYNFDLNVRAEVLDYKIFVDIANTLDKA